MRNEPGRTLAAAALVALCALPSSAADRAKPADPVAVTDRARAAALPRSAPERQGIPPLDILAFVEKADAEIDAMHSFMLVRHGHVVAEG